MPSLAALAVLGGYVGFQYVQKQRAVDFALQYAKEKGLSAARISAQPRPVSPFNWTVFVSDENAHRFAHINLVREEAKPYRPGDGFIARLEAPYLPLAQAIWVERTRYGVADRDFIQQAWNSPPLGFFRWFAEIPAFDGEDRDGKRGCAYFVDLRFDTPGRGATPFRYGACRDGPASDWRLAF